MHTITIKQMKQIMKAVVYELNEPAMFVGQFGAGKTAGIYEGVEEISKKAIVCDVRLGQYDTVDLKGYPETENGQMVWRPARTLPFVGNDAFPDNVPIFLFLDELTSANTAVFAVAYQLINERRVGEHRLKKNVYIVCAGNRENDKGVVNRMPMPLNSRMTWFEVICDAHELALHAQEKGWADETIAFLEFRKPLVNTYDPAKAEKVVAVPRTWEKADKYFRSSMPHDLKLAAMCGAIGEGPTAEFWGFVDVWKKMIPISEIIKNPATARLPEPKEAGMRYALTINISGNMDMKNVVALSTYLQRLDPEFNVLAWEMALKRDQDLFTCDEFLKISKKFRTIFN